MMNVGELKSQNNFLTVVGKLKSKFLEENVSKAGNPYLKGKVVVEVANGEEIADIELDIYVMASWKNYENIIQLKDFVSKAEAIDESFVTNVRVIGQMETNDFINKEGELISHNKFKLNKIYQSSDAPKCELDIDLTITDMKKDDFGKLKLEGFSVGFQETINELKTNIDVPMEFTEQIEKLYKVGDIAPLKIKVGVAVVENKDIVGFGVVDDKSYRKHWELIGGVQPKGSLTEEEINKAKTLRENKLIELKQTRTGGFGQSNSNPFMPTTDNDDIPF